MQLKTKKFKKAAFSYQGYTPFKIVKEKIGSKKVVKRTILQKIQFWKSPKEDVTKKNYMIHCGPLKDNQKAIMDMLPEMAGNTLTPEIQKVIEEKWIPQPQLTVFDGKEKRSLTAAEADQKRKDNPRWLPLYFQNPMQSYDYLVYESLYKNTILGPVMTQLVKFIMGTGFKPELELRNPSGDKKKDKKLIDDNKQIINDLIFVDKCVTEKTDEEGMDVTFKVKMQGLILNMLVYNRSCAVFTYDKKNPIEVRGTKFPDLPTGLIDFHPKDMGIVKISPTTQKMEALQIQQIQGFVKKSKMIYFWNSELAAPVYISKYYSISTMMPMIEPARLIRNQVSSILPAVAENMAGGLYHIFVEPQGGTEAQKLTEYLSITQATEFGTSNLFMIDPDRVKYENVNFDPKISELIQVFDAMIKYITATAKLPQIGFYDESAANHATAVEKIQLTISTSINPTREWIGEDISRQWYTPNFRTIYKGKKDLLELFRIKVVFDDLQVETLKERSESLGVLAENGITVDAEKQEEILQIEGLEDHLVKEKDMPMTEKETIPGKPSNKFNVKSKQTGEKFNVKTN